MTKGEHIQVYTFSEEELEAVAWNPVKERKGTIGPYTVFRSDSTQEFDGAMQYRIQDTETFEDILEIDSYTDPFFIIRTQGKREDIFETFDTSVNTFLNRFHDEVMAWPEEHRICGVFTKDEDAAFYSYELERGNPRMGFFTNQEDGMVSVDKKDLSMIRFDSPIGGFTIDFLSRKVRIGYISATFGSRRPDVMEAVHDFIREINPAIDSEFLERILLVLQMDSNQRGSSLLPLPQGKIEA